MRGGVGQLLAHVVRAADDAAFRVKHDGPDRHLIFGSGVRRFGERHLHVVKVERVRRVGEREVERIECVEVGHDTRT